MFLPLLDPVQDCHDDSHVAHTCLLYYKARPQIILIAQYRVIKEKVAANTPNDALEANATDPVYLVQTVF